jgi:hypothetical protein
MDGIGKLFGKCEVRGACFTPDDVGVGGVSESARNRLFNAFFCFIETVAGSFACEEGFVIFVVIGCDEIGGFGISTSEKDGGDTENVGGEARRDRIERDESRDARGLPMDRTRGEHSTLCVYREPSGPVFRLRVYYVMNSQFRRSVPLKQA